MDLRGKSALSYPITLYFAFASKFYPLTLRFPLNQSMSSSFFHPPSIYDVFLNFRGEDTRRNFVSHLYSSLSNAGINTFLDDDKIDKGQILGPALWQAIEISKICIIVFSKAYAESSWCLDELKRIMECHRKFGHVVLPVFYDVDPSDVRHQKGAFEEALKKHSRTYSGINFVLSNWKKALAEAADFVGWDVRNCR